MPAMEQTVAAAAQLLAVRFGGTPELTHPEELGGNGSSQVVRVRNSPSPFLQDRSIVIKQLPPKDGSPRAAVGAKIGEVSPGASTAAGATKGPAEAKLSDDDAAMIREVVAYQFTNTLGESGRPGPQLLAYDLDQRLLILSDAGDGENFTDILNLRPEKERRLALRKLGRALGHMHAATAGREAAYDTLLRRQCAKHGVDVSEITDRDVEVSELIRTGIELLRSTGMRINPTVVEFARAAAGRSLQSQTSAFTPFDLTPDNLMMTNRVVLLDFEWAGFRDIAFDAACVIAGFPQDTTTDALTDAETDEFLAAWRAEVAGVWPQFKDTPTLLEAIMASLIGWAFFSLTLLYYGRANLQTSGHFSITGEQLQNLTQVHLQDLATTVEAISRFAQRHEDPRFPDVAEFTHKLLDQLADMGAHPQHRAL
nr:phosphotransferase [Corynebacterium heidelbergense]